MSQIKELNDEELGKVSGGGFDNPDVSRFTKGSRVRVRFSADNAGLGWYSYEYGTVDSIDAVFYSPGVPTFRVKVWIDGKGSTAQPFDPRNVELVD